jgi:hypothetical protein
MTRVKPAHTGTQERTVFDLKFMEPQSRWVVRRLFGRDFDAFAPSSRRRINWAMLLWDLIIAYWLALLLPR